MQQQMQQQFGESTRIIKEITQELVRVGEGQKQVMTVTEQLQNLQDILKNPKQRGVLGEYYLQAVLENVLPPGSYQMQYAFSDGTIVDAVIFVKDKIISIDSKFSLENYNRIIQEHDQGERERLEKLFKQDLKNRIDETAKYVKPVEELGKHLLSYEDFMTKVGKNLATTVNAFNGAQKEFKKIDKDVVRITGSTIGIAEPLALEKPEEVV